VPIDPETPMIQVEYMLEHADVGILFTQEFLTSKVPLTSAEVLCFKLQSTDFSKFAVNNPDTP